MESALITSLEDGILGSLDASKECMSGGARSVGTRRTTGGGRRTSAGSTIPRLGTSPFLSIPPYILLRKRKNMQVLMPSKGVSKIISFPFILLPGSFIFSKPRS